MKTFTPGALAVVVFAIACESSEILEETTDGPVTCEDVERDNCIEIAAGDVTTLQESLNTIGDDTAIVLDEGTYIFDNALTVRLVNQFTLIGQGIDETILDFAAVANQTNGVDVVADDVRLEGFTVVDAKKDGIRVEDSDGVTIRGVKVTWSAGPVTENGGYGIYPVRVRNVVLEDSEAYNASDAGIYVGQCINAIVRNNIAKQNVAGIEIENTQYADVYGNLAEDNTGGLVVFDLPGNPIVGRDVHIHDNQIINNNHPNFAPGGTVSQIPAGTGTFALASRRVEISNNVYRNNKSVDIALLWGLLPITRDVTRWHIANEDIVGDISGLDLLSDDKGVFNYDTKQIWIHDNEHSGSGGDPDDKDFVNRELGFLLGVLWGEETVETILYDGWGESSFHATDASANSNDNEICIGPGEGVSFANFNLETTYDVPSMDNVYRPKAPFAPFDCQGIAAIAPEF